MALRDVTLYEALGWLLGRDEAFVGALQKSGRCKDLTEAFRNFCERNSLDYKPLFGSTAEAWERLRSEVLLGNIDLWGKAFRKGHDIDRIGVFDTPYDMEVEDSPGPPKNIPFDTLADLVADISPTEVRLMPPQWFSKGGCWWKYVEVELSQLMTRFPARQNIEKGQRRRAADGFGTRASAVLNAMQELLSQENSRDLLRELPQSERDQLINETIKKRTSAEGRRLITASASTIRRVIKDMEDRGEF